jgi:uncharacterized protein (DUF1501 family)
MKRRQFIQTSSLMTLPVLLNGMEISAVNQPKLESLVGDDSDRVLVLVQLNGGNDGLNMVIPLDQYSNLSKARPSLMLPESAVLKFNEKTGLNPAMKGMHNMFKEGLLSTVQAVGYPNQNRSHFRSTDIWTTASDANQYEDSGWMGRYFELNHAGYPFGYPNAKNPDPFAVTIGSLVSETCQGPSSNYSFALANANAVALIKETEPGENDGSCSFSETSFLRDIVKQTNAYSGQIQTAFTKAKNIATYPAGNFAGQLKIVANLIAGGLKTKIYIVNLGGFDTHANQVVDGDTINGSHAVLLANLSNSIEAFQKDLTALGVEQRVMGMTFSEFGRGIKQNVSFGTDHGTASPLFVFGSCVEGKLVGNNPTISSTISNQEGVQMQNDFRSVYATLLIDWLKVPKEDVKKILFKDFTKLGFVKDCSIISDTEELADVSPITLFPNPTADYINVKVGGNIDKIDVQIFDVRGFVVKELHGVENNGEGVEVKIEVANLPAGQYYVRLHSGKYTDNAKFMKF